MKQITIYRRNLDPIIISLGSGWDETIRIQLHDGAHAISFGDTDTNFHIFPLNEFTRAIIADIEDF